MLSAWSVLTARCISIPLVASTGVTTCPGWAQPKLFFMSHQSLMSQDSTTTQDQTFKGTASLTMYLDANFSVLVSSPSSFRCYRPDQSSFILSSCPSPSSVKIFLAHTVITCVRMKKKVKEQACTTWLQWQQSCSSLQKPPTITLTRDCLL